jgi:methyl-accepting chemotaxis protein
MRWFSNMSIRAKLLSGFCSLAVIVAGIGIVSISSSRRLAADSAEIYQRNAVPMNYLLKMTEHFQRMRGNLRDAILAPDPAAQSDFAGRVAVRVADREAAAASYRETIVSDSMKAAFAVYESAIRAYTPVQEEVLRLALTGRREEARGLMLGQGAALAKPVESALGKMASMKEASGKKLNQRNDALAARVSTTRAWSVIF